MAKQQPKLLSEALAVTRQISTESFCVRALSALLEHPPPELLQSAFNLIELFVDKYYRASAWQGLLPRLEDMQVIVPALPKA